MLKNSNNKELQEFAQAGIEQLNGSHEMIQQFKYQDEELQNQAEDRDKTLKRKINEMGGKSKKRMGKNKSKKLKNKKTKKTRTTYRKKQRKTITRKKVTRRKKNN